MKVLNKAKNDFKDMEYFAFDVTNKEISSLFNVQYQSTILIFKNNKETLRQFIMILNNKEKYLNLRNNAIKEWKNHNIYKEDIILNCEKFFGRYQFKN